MAAPEDDRGTRRERDMILAPNEYAFISDETKGEVNAFVGPNKTSLAGTDRPVVFDVKTKRFRTCDLATSTQPFQTAPEGWYIILKNPAAGDKHPSGSGKLTTPDLRVGKKVNISGPVSFPLWPGQMARVIQGHNLRSNEYLLCRVYDEAAAKENWGKAVIKTQTETKADTAPTADTAPEAKPNHRKAPAAPTSATTPSGFDLTEKDLTMGKLFVIRGVDVSFYIPSTGIEVVAEQVNGETRYVRQAVSLERLEYCLLLDQSGTKRYVHGPDVVFPRPTESFVEAPIKSNPEKAKAKKFRAQELTPASGIHIRVIADYTESNGTARKAGEELFITGSEQTIYFPREEHATIKYGEQEIHFGIAIPVGEARYVLNRDTGGISLVKGPQIFLPDPRKEVIINRALALELCKLLYPGNEEALAINAARLGVEDVDVMSGGGAEAFLNASRDLETYGAAAAVATPDTNRRVMIRGASKALPGDSFDRKNKFTAPRSIVLNTKYDGAVCVQLWTGYAMLLIRKDGNRRVVQGPGNVMFEYDESPQVLTLSRGKPKTMDSPLKTAYLLTTANKVSDIVEVETRDFCRLNVKLSYRVNFEGNPDNWFNVDNYVKFLCDHMRSRIRSAVQKLGIEEFYGNHTDLLRDIILGKVAQGEARPGTMFKENGMRIYDVEVLGVQMQNPEVEKMLVTAQRDVISNTLVLATERRKLAYVKETEALKQEDALVRAGTQQAQMELQGETAKRKLALDQTILNANTKLQLEQFASQLEAVKASSEVEALRQANEAQAAAKRREINEADAVLQRKHAAEVQKLELEKLTAQVQAVVDKAKAISPDLIAALSTFGERAMVEKVAEAMAPLSIISGGKKSVIEIVQEMLKGTPLAAQLQAVNEKSNGASTKAARA